MLTDNSEKYFFDYSHNTSDFISRTHSHDRYEIYYMAEGYRRYLIDDQVFDVQSGDVMVIPNKKIHKITRHPIWKPGDFHRRYIIYPSEEMIPAEFKEYIKQYHYRLSPQNNENVKTSFVEMHNEINNSKPYSTQIIRANLIRILGILANNPNNESLNFLRTSPIIDEITNYILKHFTEPLSLETVAQKYGFNKSYFSALFKQSTGTNYVDFLTNLRIVYATNLLKETNLSIMEISSICGYNDSNYFSSVFKKHIGITPLKYRLKFRAN